MIPMVRTLRLATFALAFGVAGFGQAAPSETIVFVAPTNHTEPLARFEQGELKSGILKDLGEAVALRLGKEARFLVMPSKRAPDALRDGTADLLCYVLPTWIGEDDFLWTPPVLPNAEVLAQHPAALALESLEDLRGRRVGTVLGYRYPDAESVLGPDLHREDAPTMRANLEKLAKARLHYAFTDRLALQYLTRHQPDLKLKEVLVFNRFTAPCAVSRRSKLSLPALNEALEAIIRSGELQRLLARYGS